MDLILVLVTSPVYEIMLKKEVEKCCVKYHSLGIGDICRIVVKVPH